MNSQNNRESKRYKSKYVPVMITMIIVTSMILSSVMVVAKPEIIEKESIPVIKQMATTHAPIRINSNSDFTAPNGVNSGSGTFADPYIINNWIIDATGFGCGIYIGNTTKYVVIKNCHLTNASGFYAVTYYYDVGTYLFSGENVTVADNNITNNNYGGILLDDSSYNTIDNNNITDTKRGISISNSYNNNITHNNVSDNTVFGISLYSSSYNNNVTDNNVTTSGTYGIRLVTTSNNNITNNNAINNYGMGIYLYSSSYNDIIENNINNNSYGVYLTSSSTNNDIYHNNFIGNTFNASDDSTNNKWNGSYNLTNRGNYWGDYVGVDIYKGWNQTILGSDGIGDTPYNITGTAGSQDMYPLMGYFINYSYPIADAGDDIFSDLGDVVFDGSGSVSNVTITNYSWSFYDGSTKYLYGVNPTYNFTNYGSYIVTLNITDANNNTDEDNMTVTIRALPVANAGSDQYVYTNSSLTLNGTNSTDNDGTIVNYTWTLDGDNYYGNVTIVNTSGFLSGTYTALLKVTDNDGANGFDNATIYMQHHPIADAGSDQYGIGIHYLNGSNSLGKITNYTWNFTYNSTPQQLYGVNVSFNFSIQGNYTITLNVTDGNFTNSDTVIIYAIPPVANAGIDDSIYRNVTYQFNGTNSTGTIANYTWNFTYNSTNTFMYGVTPTFNFSILGTYNVTLNITDIYGFSDTDSMNLTVLNQLPIADAGSNETIFKSTYQFNGTNSTDLDGHISNYTWNFTYNASAQIIYGSQPSFKFWAIGNYTVMLNVTDNDGANGFDNVTLTVLNTNPIADAGIDIVGKRVINLDGTGSYDPDGTIVNYTWNFTYSGSPVILYGVSPSFDFNISGFYNITLNVTDNDSDTDEDIVMVEIVFASPIADAGTDIVSIRGIIQFSGINSFDSDGTIINYTWNFTYNSLPAFMYGATPTFDFQIIGFYNVTLNVTDDDYRFGEDIVMVEIFLDPPIANAGADQGTLKGTYVMDGSGSTDSDGTIINYTWNFTYSSLPVTRWGSGFSFDFLLEGVYVITLNVTDDDALTDEDYVVVTIIFVPPIADAGVNRTVITWNPITINGSESSDIDGNIVNYTWNVTFGNTTTILYGIEQVVSFDESGTANVTLTVTDDDGLMSNDTIVLTVLNPMTETFNFLLLLLPLLIIMLFIVWLKRRSRELTEGDIT